MLKVKRAIYESSSSKSNETAKGINEIKNIIQKIEVKKKKNQYSVLIQTIKKAYQRLKNENIGLKRMVVELEKFIVKQDKQRHKKNFKRKRYIESIRDESDHELFRPRSNKNRQKKKTQKYYENYYSDTVDGQIEEK